MRAALSDAAVGNDLAIRRDALALVKRLQLLSGEERPGRRVDSLRPGDVLGARDMTWLLRLLLGQVRRGQQFAAVLLWRANVDEAELGIADHLLIDELPQRAYVVCRPPHLIAGSRLHRNRVNGHAP